MVAQGLSEFELIRRFFARSDRAPPRAGIPSGSVRSTLGIGDDCALLGLQAGPPGHGDQLAISTDMLVAGRHFFDDVDAEALGHKALAVNLSDLAAMGAAPRAFTLALALPVADSAWLERFAHGLFALADSWGAELVGGDTTRGPLAICITVFGEVPAAVALRRDRARPGDDVWVSGALGAAAWAVRRRLDGVPLVATHPAVARLERPVPRVALGLALRGIARAAIDLSDGLVGDLQHVLDRSGVGAEIDVGALPLDADVDDAEPSARLACALVGGDDYELLFTAPSAARAAVAAAAASSGLSVTHIGTITEGGGLRFKGDAALLARLPPTLQSYDHFSAP